MVPSDHAPGASDTGTEPAASANRVDPANQANRVDLANRIDQARRVDRVAVLSDIHAVLPALEAVLAEPEVRTADLIVLTGDIAAGPMPCETLDRLDQLGDQALWIRGNCDRIQVSQACAGVSLIDSIESWSAAQLRPRDVQRLDGLPFDAVLDVNGLGPTYFCHATPTDDQAHIPVDSPSDEFAELTAVSPEVSTIVCGHTHMPFARLAHGKMVVNPGSVGMPFGRPGAHWALLGEGVGISFRRTEFDVPAAIQQLVEACDFRVPDGVPANHGLPDTEAWARTYLTGAVAEADVLARFASRRASRRSAAVLQEPS